MRLRLLRPASLLTATATALITTALIGGVVGTVHAAPTAPHRAAGSMDPGSMDLGSTGTGLFSQASIFLWQNPGARYVVVLGAKMGTLGQTPAILDRRLDVAAALGRTHPFNRIVVSGGDTWWLPVSEAQFMNLGLLQRAIPVWQMVNEGQSTSTVQNATYTVRMLKAMGADGAVIVTNGFHMQRAMQNFRDAARIQRARITFLPAYA